MQFLVYNQHDFGPGMATFYRSTPSENLDQMEISQEELIPSMQDGQAALVAYNQMHCEIRNLQQQMVTLNNNMEELKSRSCEAKGGKGQKKLLKRLLVRVRYCLKMSLIQIAVIGHSEEDLWAIVEQFQLG